jgi:hypothetical protein
MPRSVTAHRGISVVIIGAVTVVGTVNTTFHAMTTTFASPPDIEAHSIGGG